MLIKSKNTLKISASDFRDGYIVNKIKAGENVSIDIQSGDFGEQLCISANKTQGRSVRILNDSGVVNSDDYLVLVDASANHIEVTLPPAADFIGPITIVCLDPSNGIEIIPNKSTSNVIFDATNAGFNSRGDSITLISDKGRSLPAMELVEASDNEIESGEAVAMLGVNDIIYPGTWYIISKYCASWYA